MTEQPVVQDWEPVQLLVKEGVILLDLFSAVPSYSKTYSFQQRLGWYSSCQSAFCNYWATWRPPAILSPRQMMIILLLFLQKFNGRVTFMQHPLLRWFVSDVFVRQTAPNKPSSAVLLGTVFFRATHGA